VSTLERQNLSSGFIVIECRTDKGNNFDLYLLYGAIDINEHVPR